MSQSSLPGALKQSEDFSGLNPVQARALEARYDHISEIQTEISKWLSAPSARETLKHFLDNIELDVGAALKPSGDPNEGISAWVLHSVWASDISVGQMRASLQNDALRALDESIPSVDCKAEDFLMWLERQALVLRDLLDAFQKTSSYATAMAHAIAIDALLANLLAALYRARLSRLIQG